jgi:hypothetical protein
MCSKNMNGKLFPSIHNNGKTIVEPPWVSTNSIQNSDEILILVLLIGIKRYGLIWSSGGFAVKVRMNMESNFETSQEVHKRGEIQIE